MVVGAHTVMEKDALMLITAKGKMIRMQVSDIRVISRVTQGVRLIDLDEGDKLVSATTVEPEDDELILADLAHDDPEALAKLILEQGLSVRQAEAMAQARAEKAGKTAKARPRGQKDADTRAMERQLGDALGLRVAIEARGEGGELRIRYKSLEQLEEVCRRLLRGR